MTTAPTTIDKKPPLQDFFAAFFILSAPYLSFVDHHEFYFEYLNLWVLLFFALLAGLGAALLKVAPHPAIRVLFFSALLMYFCDIQFEWFYWWGKKLAVTGILVLCGSWLLRAHLSRILAVTFGTLILGLVIASAMGSTLFGTGASATATEVDRELPVYVHIVLDEHAGIEAFDPAIENQKAIREELAALFDAYGFRLFGRAFSHYYDSNDSIASALNLTASDTPGQWYERRSGRSQLLQSSYFEGIRAAGYRINVYQSSYMDYCHTAGATAVAKCRGYNHDSVSSSALDGLETSEKNKIVLSMYANLSFFLSELRAPYPSAGSGSERPTSNWRDWRRWNQRVGPIPVLPVFDELIEDVASSGRGTMYFAHLLIPHYPYVVDSQCQIRRPVMSWLNRDTVLADTPNDSNTEASRRLRYDEYILQVRCVIAKLRELFEAIDAQGNLDDAIIVVHGDHGSRIVIHEPLEANQTKLSRQDFLDSFSTLFAVRSPEVPPGYDSSMFGLPRLLRGTVVEPLEPKLLATDQPAFVYLRENIEDTVLSRVAMPAIPSRHP